MKKRLEAIGIPEETQEEVSQIHRKVSMSALAEMDDPSPLATLATLDPLARLGPLGPLGGGGDGFPDPAIRSPRTQIPPLGAALTPGPPDSGSGGGGVGGAGGVAPGTV